MEQGRDLDIFRIIGQLETNIQNLQRTHIECREERKKDIEDIRKKLIELREELIKSIDLKVDIKTLIEIEKELKHLQEVLGLDRSGEIKRSLNVMNAGIMFITILCTSIASIAGFYYLLMGK